MPSVDELLEDVYGIRVIRDHPYLPDQVLLVNMRALEPNRDDRGQQTWRLRWRWVGEYYVDPPKLDVLRLTDTIP